MREILGIRFGANYTPKRRVNVLVNQVKQELGLPLSATRKQVVSSVTDLSSQASCSSSLFTLIEASNKRKKLIEKIFGEKVVHKAVAEGPNSIEYTLTQKIIKAVKTNKFPKVKTKI